jgi:hydrogenase nickel incorporation protein HypB
MNTQKSIRVGERVLSDNDRIAGRLRLRFAEQGTLVVNLISSPGSGKTSLLEATVRTLGKDFRTGSVVGDIATERDADRLRALGIPASQILTGGACHLDARLVKAALNRGGFEWLDFLFIENVGNLVCPSSYDLGEDLRLVLLSVTEGEDKPLKYPTIFNTADVAVITKRDIAEAVEFDADAADHKIQSVRPGMRVMKVSAKTGAGIGEWLTFLTELGKCKRNPMP